MAYVNVIPDRYTKETFDPSRYEGLEPVSSRGAVIEVRTNGVTLDLSGVVLDGEGDRRSGHLGPRLQKRHDH